jgi:hypothetical protein
VDSAADQDGRLHRPQMEPGPALFATCRTLFAVGRKNGEQAFVSFAAP